MAHSCLDSHLQSIVYFFTFFFLNVMVRTSRVEREVCGALSAREAVVSHI